MHAIVSLQVNGERHETGVPAHYTLLETLRYGLGLTGSKQGCDKGDCGACTVLVDGEPVLSCITPVWEAEGRDVRTVEGLARPGRPHALQRAFNECGAAQCGFCTPGVLMSAWGLLRREPRPARQAIREALSGNLCRCTGYTKIYEAVERAAEWLEPRHPATDETAEHAEGAQSRAPAATGDKRESSSAAGVGGSASSAPSAVQPGAGGVGPEANG